MLAQLARGPAWLKESRDTLVEVRRIASHISRYRPDLLGPPMLLALALLAETVSQVLKDVLTIDAVRELMQYEKIHHENWRLASISGELDPGKPLLDHMERRGWCRHDPARMKMTMDHVGTLYYIARMDPPRAHADHSECANDTCVVQRINLATYELAHTARNCMCDLIYVDTTRISDALYNGHIPLLEEIHDNSDPVPVRVRAYVPGENFVAISHVWAEGLGNPFNNGLHACQLEDLFKYTVPLSPDGKSLPIWIDTICVPVRPRDLHQLAMKKMRDPYRFASHVLVLDAYLMKAKAENLDTSGIFARILC